MPATPRLAAFAALYVALPVGVYFAPPVTRVFADVVEVEARAPVPAMTSLRATDVPAAAAGWRRAWIEALRDGDLGALLRASCMRDPDAPPPPR